MSWKRQELESQEEEDLSNALKSTSREGAIEKIDEKKIKICDNCGMKFVYKLKGFELKNGKKMPIFMKWHLDIRNGRCPRGNPFKRRFWRK